MTTLRDRFLTPGVARAITSPSAILLAGVGAAAGVLAFGNPVAAVALGAAGVGVRVAAALARGSDARLRSPRRLREPWRTLATEVLDARRRFDDAVGGVRPGPLRERLDELGRRLDGAVAAASETAAAGDSLSEGRGRIDVERIRAEWHATQGAPDTEGRRATLAALEAQLAAADRLDRTIAETYDRLRVLDARIDETVTRAIELSVSQVDPGAVAGLGDEVSRVVGDMEALRQAVEETHRAQPGTA